jgi:hypothetical protein
VSRNRRRIPLAFGPGLDRATGPMVVEPGKMEDLRNFYLLDGKLQARKGFAAPGTLSDDGVPEITHVLAGHALRSEGVGIIVGWASVAGEVHVFRTEPDGTSSFHLGKWFDWTLEDAEYPPIIHMAESFGRIFMAHDEPNPFDRAPTFVYDPITPQEEGLLSPLVDTFSGAIPQVVSESEPGSESPGGMVDAFIKFRGVVSHLDYLFGWGYGTAELDRPEMVRCSLPGEPRNFLANHYWIVGNRQDPVLQCVPGASSLVAFKAGEWWEIFGTNRRNFGHMRRDPLFGLLHPRLAVNVSGLVFFWSPDGPRVTDGSSPSESLEIPLDLQGYEPEDLPEEVSPCEAFATYVWADRIVLFVFGRRAYALTVRVNGDWKWSYWTFDWPGKYPLCAFTLWETILGLLGAPLGYPVAEDETPAGTYVDLLVRNVNQEGGERLEVWMRPTAAPVAYALVASTDVSLLPTQTVRVGDRIEGVEYEYSLRYRRGNQIAPGYAGDPSTWPEVSQGSFTTTLNPPLVGEVYAALGARFAALPDDEWVWERTSDSSQYLQFRIFPTSETAGHAIKVYRRPRFGVHTPTLVGTLVEGTDFTFAGLGEDGGFTFRDTDPPQDGELTYFATSEVGATESPGSDPLHLWPGPQPEAHKGAFPGTWSVQFESGNERYTVRAQRHRVNPGEGSNHSAIRFSDNSPFLLAPTSDRGTITYGGSSTPVDQKPPTFGAEELLARKTVDLPDPFPSGSTFIVGFQYEATRFGVLDRSPFIQRSVIAP